MKSLTALSVFSGIGGLDVAASSAGFTITAQIEIDSYCRQVLKKNAPSRWENAKQFADIRDVTASQIGKVSLIFGGFPCQDISIAGNQEGLRVGNRSGLYFELLRLIGDIQPEAVILENVSNILVQGLGIVTGTLSEIGYDAIWQIIPAAHFGAPHRRDRWFCIALGNSQRKGLQGGNRYKLGNRFTTESSEAQLGYSMRSRWNRNNKQIRRKKSTQGHSTYERTENQSKPGMGGDSNGLSNWMDFPGFPAAMNDERFDYEPPIHAPNSKHRANRIKALGNAVVPIQAYPFFEAVKQLLIEEL